MTYDDFREQTREAIRTFPMGRIFYLREIFGTEVWNGIQTQKASFGGQFYREYKAGKFPDIEEYDKSQPQGEQRYKKVR